MVNILSFLPVVILIAAADTKDIFLPIIGGVIHEAGHLLCAALVGMKISSVSFSLGGATIGSNSGEVRDIKRAAVLVSGSAVNLITAAISWIAGMNADFIAANTVLGIFNLLPIKGLDGGSTLELILDGFLMPRDVYRIVRGVSMAFLLLLWLISVAIMMFSEGNITMYCVVWMLFFANYRAFL